MPHNRTRNGLLLAVVLLLLTGINGMAVILHPDGQPPADYSDIPDPNVIGRWGTNASCVAIGRNLVITTVHQENIYTPHPEILRDVQIGGVIYTPDAYWTTTENDDIRIVKLHHANLAKYVGIYKVTNNSSTREPGKSLRIGGFGKGRDDNATPFSYGYTWDGTYNTTLRFCTNTVDGIYPYDNNVIYADFDNLDVSGSTTFEGTAAEYDSGSGWFIYDGGWKLAGLTYSVTPHDEVKESWFDDPGEPGINPDLVYAWRISRFVAWIDSVINSQQVCTEIVQSDLDGNCLMDESDLIEFAAQWLKTDCGPLNNYCQGADFDGIDGVNMADFATLAADWLNDYRPLTK